MGLKNELILTIIWFSVLGLGATIEWIEWKVKRHIKNNKATRKGNK